jgi:hypothetical protein
METLKFKDLSFEALCGIIAKVIHSANRAYVDAIGGRAVNLTWEEIREEERQGLIKAVASMIVNPQLPETSHEQWCLAREKEGWTKDVRYDYNRKTHPNLIPYDQLPLEEQFKDHMFMGIASIFCGSLSILDMPEVQAARRILQAQFAGEPVEAKIPEVDDDPVVDPDREKPPPSEPLDPATIDEINEHTESPAETEGTANDTVSEDQSSKQESDELVKTSDEQESTANGVGKLEPEGKAIQAEDQDKEVEPAKPKAKKPAKKSSDK